MLGVQCLVLSELHELTQVFLIYDKYLATRKVIKFRNLVSRVVSHGCKLQSSAEAAALWNNNLRGTARVFDNFHGKLWASGSVPVAWLDCNYQFCLWYLGPLEKRALVPVHRGTPFFIHYPVRNTSLGTSSLSNFLKMHSINQSRDHINYQLIYFLACADISYLSVNLIMLVTIKRIVISAGLNLVLLI